MKKQILISLFSLTFFIISCKKDKEKESSLSDVFIINQGLYNSSTGEISGYNPETETVSNNLFKSANPNATLGDIAQSSIILNDELFVAVNNSHKIEVLDANTLVRKRVLILPDGNYPRYMSEGVGNELLVTNLYNPNVLRVNKETGDILGLINVGYDSEAILKVGNQVFVALPGSWPDYHNEVAVVNLTNYTVEKIIVGVSPTRLELDSDGLVWVLCVGTWGNSNAKIYAINSASKKVVYSSSLSGGPTDFTLNSSANELYIDNGLKLQVFDVSAKTMKSDSIQRGGFYDIAFSELENRIYALDPLDYVQNGLLWIYDTAGKRVNLDTLKVGVIPGYIQFH